MKRISLKSNATTMRDHTVYILGAGFNQFLEDFNNIKPPLAHDFFRKALLTSRFNSPLYMQRLDALLKYIHKYWGYSLQELKKSDLDIEEIFTLLQQQIEKAKSKARSTEILELVTLSFQLEAFLSEFLSNFTPFNPKKPEGYLSLIKFGRHLLAEQSTVITFNYDTILEDGIAAASGVAKPPKVFSRYHKEVAGSKKLPESLIKYSHSNWNRILSYGFKFDYVQLPQPGLSRFAERKEYYGKNLNRLYKMQLLKLHGSLNWMEVAAPIDKNAWGNSNHPSWKEFPAKILQREGVIYQPGHWRVGMPPTLGTWFLRPKIITPVLYKQSFYSRHPFPILWEKALHTLKQCRRLVVIGYSFAPTDFTTKQLFLEAFSSNSLDELTLVNPDHTGDIKTIIKKLTRFTKPICWYSTVEDYLK